MQVSILKSIVKDLPDDLDMWFGDDFDIDEIRIDNTSLMFVSKFYEANKLKEQECKDNV